MNRNGRKGLFVLVFLFFAGMAAFSGYKVYTILTEYRVGAESAQNLQQYVTLQPEVSETAPAKMEISVPDEPAADTPAPTEITETIEATEATEATEPSVQYPVVDFEALKKVNSDVHGWIYIAGTSISFPIVQGVDNDYYLTRLPDGTSNSSGSIFLDYRNASDFSDYHTIIYGHNMKNGTMFADVTKYKKKAYYEEHSVGMIMTPQGNFQIEVIGGYVADLWDPAWNLHFETEQDRQDWLRDAMARSDVGGDYVPAGGEKIITLSTCSYEFDDARFVLICRVLDEF